MKTCETCGRQCNYLHRHRQTIQGKRITVFCCSKCNVEIIETMKKPRRK